MGGFGQGPKDELYNQHFKGVGAETLRTSWRRLTEAEDRLGRKRKNILQIEPPRAKERELRKNLAGALSQ